MNNKINEFTVKEPVIFITENEKYGFKNPDTNEIVIEPKYDYAEDFVDGLAAVELNGKYGFIDRAGKVVVPIIYDSIMYFIIRKDLRTKLNGKWCSIDKTNKVVEIKNEEEILELEQFTFRRRK